MTYRNQLNRKRQPLRNLLIFTGIAHLSAFLLAFQPLPQQLFALGKQPLPENPTTPLPTDVPAIRDTVVDRVATIDAQLVQLEKAFAPANSYNIPTQFQGQTFTKVELQSGEKVVALTFDDGPMPDTPHVLDILKKYEVPATFFVVGSHMRVYPEYMKRVVEEGHAVGNHTWHHDYHNIDEATAAAELGRTADLLQELTGVQTRLFRPPGGNLTNGLVAYAARNNYGVAMWSLDSLDYASNSGGIAERVIGGIHSGAIVLLHDGGGPRTATVEALPQIIQALQKQGYRFVTLPQLLQIKASETPKDVAATP
ncbi:MAG: polysaccharide deacetylase family protein [Cyanobacteriota bacterium]|nr:polysaccharide deacetylase family protein [Cyanobacteriota bacterium]